MTAPSVLIDMTAVPIDRRGVGRYVDELVAAMDRPVFLACQAEDAEHYRAIAPGATVLPQSGIRRVARRLLWEQFSLPWVARRAGARVIHSPHYTMPLFTRLARVVTFHDATFFSDPELHTRVKWIFFRTWIRVSRRLASAIIVDSAATASELCRYLGGSPERYRVIHLGVDGARFRPPTPAEVAHAANALGLEDAPWIAFLGTIEPRKNLPELLRAYSAVAEHWDAVAGPVPTLAIAGGAGWGTPIDDEVAAVSPRGRVIRLGHIDLALLPAYLGGAQVVAYPSLGEGFGLPVLEAMACAAPVLTTRRLAIPEVGGEAVAYSEPDAAALAAALRMLLTSLPERQRLSALGLARASTFTWAACARAHAAVYDSVLPATASEVDG